MEELGFYKNLLFNLEFWGWKLVYISILLAIMLGHRNFRLKGTLEFINIDCKVIDIEEGHVMFRVDCDI